jgi:hypothetical protein
VIGASGHPSEQDGLDQISILTIGLPDVEHAQELVAALEDCWACCTFDAEPPMTVVFLSPRNLTDFRELVRRVQGWLTERSLGAIAFEARASGHIHGRSAN